MPTVTYDQPGATYDEPLFTYDQDSASPFPMPPAPASLVGTDGWLFEAISPSGVRTPFRPEITATLSNDASRETRRIADGIVLVPSEAAKVDLVADLVAIYLRVDGVAHPMGIYRFTEDSLAENAVTDDTGAPADLVYASLGDQFARLRASDEVARLALAGTDPSQVMIEVLAAAGLPHSIAGSVAPFAVDVVWAAGTTAEAIVSQCAEVAGHRRPWMDNTGVIRSIAANVLETEVIPLADLGPVAGSTVITNTRLFSPNRFLVVDDTAASPTTGTWDAPASAPNSAVHRGWVQTEIITQQGLSGAAHAQAVAATLGEAAGARKLAAVIRPTWRLDGPVILAHRSAYWMVVGWSIPIAAGATMSVDAVEILLDYTPPPDAPFGTGGGGGFPPLPPPSASYATEVLADNPLMYYRLGDAAGPTAADSSGNARDATYDPGAVPVAGLLVGDPNGAVQAPDTISSGSVIMFDAGSDFATGLTEASLECWYSGGTNHRGRITASSAGNTMLEILADDYNGFGLRVNFGNTAFYSDSFDVTAAPVNDGGPHHIVITWDGTTITAYVDGAAVGTGALTGTMAFEFVYADPLRLTMILDEVALYGTALSLARIAAHYAAGT